ncbi:K(+) efflux antiporter 6 isoform X4 [Juglans microcarpa x Juglans regia]|uniref:K(+) efflux antiporter 6 isoform X4 n=1 Tax=Juglans microcarpa x Juglans regia TaxID=2249226 RepID=UPI001B7ED6AE|nr:K(+) efflux antiporter 6 isoform X4 [Juglans microcarpa x Juglans regia]
MLKKSPSLESSLFLFAVAAPTLLLLCFSALLLTSPSLAESDRLDSTNSTESNVSLSTPKEASFAQMIDQALANEFSENDQPEAADAGGFNNSVAEQQAVLETVARVKSKKNDTKEDKSFQLHNVFNLDTDNRAEDTPTLIDRKDNVFIISNFKSKYPVLQLDLRLISDLVVVIVSATCGGIAFACAGQPVITGYLLAGSFIGPGGFNFVSEMVQVETVAQFGVVFLLFALGLEFSTTKLCGGKASEGVFVGALLSMSSTAVVLKFLMEKNSTNSLHGQVTIGTLILQDCAVGLLFALLPVLGGTSGVLQGVMSMTKVLVVLITFLAVLTILSRTCVPWLLKLMISLSSQTNELYQLASVAFCLLVAWCSDKLGLSLELGSFAAGVMISTTDLAQHTLDQVEPIRNLFAALFLASIGMLIHVQFLWNHVDILLASVLLVIIVKTIIISAVVKGFTYNNKTSLLVGMSLAQIGEFAFVLLSRASNLHLVEGKVYLLLLGTTALSLVTTPLLFKLIPAVVHLGVLLRWFSPDGSLESGFKGENLRSESLKQRTLLIDQGPHDS